MSDITVYEKSTCTAGRKLLELEPRAAALALDGDAMLRTLTARREMLQRPVVVRGDRAGFA